VSITTCPRLVPGRHNGQGTYIGVAATLRRNQPTTIGLEYIAFPQHGRMMWPCGATSCAPGFHELMLVRNLHYQTSSCRSGHASWEVYGSIMSRKGLQMLISPVLSCFIAELITAINILPLLGVPPHFHRNVERCAASHVYLFELRVVYPSNGMPACRAPIVGVPQCYV